MGFFAKLGRTPAPTTTDLVRDDKRASAEEDIEKRTVTLYREMYFLIPFQRTWIFCGNHLLIFSGSRIATVQAGVQNWQGEMALRFFLGVTEAGFGPGVPFLLSFFYLRHEVGFRIGIFLSAAPLANTFAGALAYGITSGRSKLANWRLLFLVEGLPSMVMAAVAFFFLPDSPDKATFLTEEEKLIAKARGVRQVGDVEKRVGSVAWKDVGAALLDVKFFLPTILEGMGYSSVNAQGLTAPPYFLSFLVTIFSTWVADRIQQRGYIIMFLTSIGGIGYILLAACDTVGVRYFGVFLAASDFIRSNILPWTVNNQGSDTRRGVGIVLLNLIGQCGPLLGTNIFPKNEGPRYVKGMAICAAFTWFTGALAIGLRLLLIWENEKLDKKYGTRAAIIARRTGDLAGQESVQSEENYGEAFRYIL
ncbi:MAG: hypothetical protein Q9191_001123 [Dirinaria sp. TL-2023a]